jgi:hypothetical protein
MSLAENMSLKYDSSSDDESSYATTNVLLGYASKEPTGDDISYLGGSPVFCLDAISLKLLILVGMA